MKDGWLQLHAILSAPGSDHEGRVSLASIIAAGQSTPEARNSREQRLTGAESCQTDCLHPVTPGNIATLISIIINCPTVFWWNGVGWTMILTNDYNNGYECLNKLVNYTLYTPLYGKQLKRMNGLANKQQSNRKHCQFKLGWGIGRGE